jgi:hypothetical protein
MGIGKLRIALRSAMGSEGGCCYELLHSVRDAQYPLLIFLFLFGSGERGVTSGKSYKLAGHE